jgi:hypothetical protein
MRNAIVPIDITTTMKQVHAKAVYRVASLSDTLQDAWRPAINVAPKHPGVVPVAESR